MHFLQRIRIRTKLLFLVAFMLVLVLFVSFMGINSVLDITGGIEKSARTVTLPMEALNKANYAYGQMMLQTRDLSQVASTDDADAAASATSEVDGVSSATSDAGGDSGGGGWVLDVNTETYAEVQMRGYADAINSYFDIMKNNGITTGEEYDALMTVINTNNEILPMIQQCIDFAKKGEAENAAEYMVNEVKPRTGALDEALQDLTQINKVKSENILSDAEATKRSSLNTIYLALAIGIICITPIVILIILAIVKPLNAMTEKAALLAGGNINIQVSGEGKDEISILARSFNDVINTLKSLISAMENMSRLQAEGDYDAIIDVNAFDGAYKNVAAGINKMMMSSTSEQQEVLSTFLAFATGNFDAPSRSFPGKKKSINEAIELFRSQLKDIYKEIHTLVSAASAGRLSDRIKTEKYSGDWVSLMTELNNLLNTIINPINEASSVLSEISAGNFNVYVTGDYKGDMAIIKNSVNNTVSAISSYINEITEVLDAISSDDLTKRVDREYIGQFTGIKNSLNRITVKLTNVIAGISVASSEVATGAEHIASSNAMVADGATKQSATIQQLIAAIDTVSDNINKNTDNTTRAIHLSEASCRYVADGNNKMHEMLKSMTDINESSANIARNINVIQDIASQTNLLALNASVEAARAGIHGRGFSVVADEVRSLATKSQQAANDITVLIEKSINIVKEGTTIANSSNESLDKIAGSVNEVSDIIRAIANATKEQSTSIGTLGTGLAEISDVALSNSAFSQENLASSEELSGQSMMLNDMTKAFKLK